MDQPTKTKVIEGLRARQGDQIMGRFYNHPLGKGGCALGIMAEALGYDRADAFNSNSNFIGAQDGPVSFLMKRGFELATLRKIVAYNDEMKVSFDFIADYIDRDVKVPVDVMAAFRASWINDVEKYANNFKALVTA